MNRRGFIGGMMAAMACLVGVNVAKEKPAPRVETPRGPDFCCYHCYIQGLIESDIRTNEFGDRPPYPWVPTHHPVTHIMEADLPDGSKWKNYWCDKHAPVGSTKFRTLEQAMSQPACGIYATNFYVS